MPHSWRLANTLTVAAALAAPLAWLAYLIVRMLREGLGQDYTVNQFQELVSWVNIALVPLLAILALTTFLSTGNRQAEALAVAALAFAAVFPLHRLFTAAQNDITFRFFGTPARCLFVILFVALSGRTAPVPPVRRRRRVILILVLTGGLALLLRFSLKGFLEELAATQSSRFTWIYDFLELLAFVLAGKVALRLAATEPSRETPAPLRLAAAFGLTAAQALFFLFSNRPDAFWWGGNVLWALATLLEIWAMFSTASGYAAGPGGAPRTLAIGSTLGNYEILGWLGEGGMGQIFKARNRRLRREVAVKVIRPQQLANPETLERFRREARATASLAHPNIVQVYDAAETDGLHYLVMEYVPGKDLGELLIDRGPLPPALACEYIRQASLGLQHAHERNLIHRDIKPANLLLAADGTQVKLLDLGVARVQIPDAPESSLSDLTQTGAVMGTPAYLAPEQARHPRHADIRADIYSLGCTLYHLLTGQVPFPGVTLAEVVLQHQLEEPPPIDQWRAGIPADLQVILRKMMAKRPEDRYQIPADVADALAPFARVDADLLASWGSENLLSAPPVGVSTPAHPDGS
jgi:tRNA A-37 threonylcarbamoyl transferase component Bud32